MTNEEILKAMHERGAAGYGTAMDLARSDEREKITEETVKEYFAGLNGKETALVVLNYLLRGGITDEDLRGLRLQWIKEQPEGVVAWITASKHYAEIYIGGDEPNRMIWGHFYKSSKEQHCSRLNRHTARLLGVELNQCAKFKIVRCE